MNAHFTTRSTCPVCNSGSPVPVFSRPYADQALRAALEKFYAAVGELDYEALLGADFVVCACDDCGLLFQRNIPDDFLLEQLYERWISPEQAYERFHSHLSRTRELEIRREVRLSLALVRDASNPPRVLDYGCGWGEWLRVASALGAELWGTELSAARREACACAGIKIASDDELPERYFDLINADQVFEHLPTPAATLALLKTKLRRGGVIRIAVPNAWRARGKLGKFDREIDRPRLGGLNPIAPLEHLNGFTTRSLIRLANDCGLERLVPSWRMLLHGLTWPPTARAKLKQALLPFYLRSRWSTQLWFRFAPLPSDTASA